MTKLNIVKSAIELEKEEAFYARLSNPVEAWYITKWYAKCSECKTDNELSVTDGFLAGARETQACNKCGVRFAFRFSHSNISTT